MTLAPSEQRSLLRMERSLRADPALNEALRAFRCHCCRGVDSEQEDMSPWHPVLWRAELLALIAVSLAFFTMVAVLAWVAR